jgi:excisionase family DNA binding protein
MQLMSIEDLAAYLGDSKRTIYKYIASGDCPPYIRISAKNIKFDRADVDAWLESKKVFSIRSLPWTKRAERVMKLAEHAAKKDGQAGVSTGHLLLGIAEVEECLGAVILKNLGVDLAKPHQVYEKLSDQEKSEGQAKLSADKRSLTEPARTALRCASEEALRLGHEYIGAEHLLAGLLLVGDGLGCRILAELGVTVDRVRAETAKLIVCQPVARE